MFRSPHLESAAIREAHPRIHPVFRDTPQYVHEGLSASAGVPVIVKIETVNPIRSFKGRGTWIALSALEGEGRITRDRPVVCASAGNFGQGVAYAARALGIRAVVFCSTRANRGKVARMRALGAEVIEAGEDFDEARSASEAYAAANDAELLVDGDDVRIAIPRAVELMSGRVDAMVTVSEDDLHAAQILLTAELGITVEGAAPASWAGLLGGPRPDGPFLVVITGSNV